MLLVTHKSPLPDVARAIDSGDPTIRDLRVDACAFPAFRNLILADDRSDTSGGGPARLPAVASLVWYAGSGGPDRDDDGSDQSEQSNRAAECAATLLRLLRAAPNLSHLTVRQVCPLFRDEPSASEDGTGTPSSSRDRDVLEGAGIRGCGGAASLLTEILDSSLVSGLQSLFVEVHREAYHSYREAVPSSVFGRFAAGFPSLRRLRIDVSVDDAIPLVVATAALRLEALWLCWGEVEGESYHKDFHAHLKTVSHMNPENLPRRVRADEYNFKWTQAFTKFYRMEVEGSDEFLVAVTSTADVDRLLEGDRFLKEAFSLEDSWAGPF
ncbi:hypothetical protein HK405_011814 [Cladochytrium tenue]|nr:hypothetical protein HK405_011814 [Cladochytrium tenue]